MSTLWGERSRDYVLNNLWFKQNECRNTLHVLIKIQSGVSGIIRALLWENYKKLPNR